MVFTRKDGIFIGYVSFREGRFLRKWYASNLQTNLCFKQSHLSDVCEVKQTCVHNISWPTWMLMMLWSKNKNNPETLIQSTLHLGHPYSHRTKISIFQLPILFHIKWIWRKSVNIYVGKLVTAGQTPVVPSGRNCSDRKIVFGAFCGPLFLVGGSSFHSILDLRMEWYKT